MENISAVAKELLHIGEQRLVEVERKKQDLEMQNDGLSKSDLGMLQRQQFRALNIHLKECHPCCFRDIVQAHGLNGLGRDNSAPSGKAAKQIQHVQIGFKQGRHILVNSFARWRRGW